MSEEKNAMKKIIGTEWRTGRGFSFGIVATQQAGGKWRAYIGPAPGADEKTDAEYIADWGAKLNKREAVAFFPDLNPDLFDEEK